MTDKDVIFKFYGNGERPNPDCFCHYGWEGTGSFAFWKYAVAYFDSAEALFDKFKQSRGDFAILDGIGLTICFLYRHFVELSVKYLFIKFGAKDINQYKDFLQNGHNLFDLWKETKPVLKGLRQRAGSSVSIGCLEHYILEFHKFDEKEEAMRYPVKNNLEQMHESTRLDIYSLHDRMLDYFKALEGIAADLENQLFEDVPQGKLDEFALQYDKLRGRVLSFISEMKRLVAEEKEDERKKFGLDEFLESLKKPDPRMTYLIKCTDDELILLDALYYLGRMVNCKELTLPRNPHDAKVDAYKMCVINMAHDHLEFGKPKNEEINIWGKTCSMLCKNVTRAVEIIDWDKPEVLEKL